MGRAWSVCVCAHLQGSEQSEVDIVIRWGHCPSLLFGTPCPFPLRGFLLKLFPPTWFVLLPPSVTFEVLQAQHKLFLNRMRPPSSWACHHQTLPSLASPARCSPVHDHGAEDYSGKRAPSCLGQMWGRGQGCIPALLITSCSTLGMLLSLSEL